MESEGGSHVQGEAEMTGDPDVQRGQRTVSRRSGGAQVGSLEKQRREPGAAPPRLLSGSRAAGNRRHWGQLRGVGSGGLTSQLPRHPPPSLDTIRLLFCDRQTASLQKLLLT